jgi:hypothetical protein
MTGTLILIAINAFACVVNAAVFIGNPTDWLALAFAGLSAFVTTLLALVYFSERGRA